MTQCWSEGELRAYLDGELPVRDVERVAGHMKDCEACARVCADLAERAARVAALLEVLPEPAPASKIPAIRRGRARTGRWAAAAGLAAALAVALVMVPWRTRPGLGPVQPKVARVPQAEVMRPADIPLPDGRGSDRLGVALPDRRASDQPGIPLPDGHGSEKGAAAPTPKPRVEDYVALDDEPIEAGVVVRVGLGGGQIPADVIFGSDGRARAIRLVNDNSGER
jgi:anti-sigma factor RsiW